jgi:hypothetical protein
VKSRRLVSPVMGALLLFAGVVTAASPALAQSGTPIPEDSPVYKSFMLLKSQPSYHTTMNLKSNDPNMAQMAAMGMGFSPIERIQQGDTSLVVMHLKFPAMDVPGTVDDWEIRAVARNGRAARMFSSPAIPRLKRMQEQEFAMQMAMLEKQSSMAVVQALAEGPTGVIHAGMLAGESVAFAAMAARSLKKAEQFWDWKCLDQPGESGGGSESQAQLTDAKLVGDDTVNGTAVTAYDFYAKDSSGMHGPMRVFIAKGTSLPLRIHLDDPQGHGSVDMDYSYGTNSQIEVPGCLGK